MCILAVQGMPLGQGGGNQPSVVPISKITLYLSFALPPVCIDANALQRGLQPPGNLASSGFLVMLRDHSHPMDVW